MAKCQYLVREYAFRVLRQLPLGLQKKAVDLFVKRRRNWLATLQTPALLILYVTNRCNARCSHCFYWQEVKSGQKKELTVEEIKKIACSLANPLATLSLTGGEPFLRNDLVQICHVFYRLNQTQKINIVTNGFFTTKITKDVEQILKKCPLDLNIQVSLDGMEKIHNHIRRISIFKRALATINVLEKLAKAYKNLQVTIQTTVTSQNLAEIAKLARFIKKRFPLVHHGFQFVRSSSFDVYQIDRKILSGYDPRAKKPLISLKEMEQVLSIINRFTDQSNTLLYSYIKRMNEGIVKMKKQKRPLVKCLAGKYDGVIWPDGQVSMCEFTQPFADLKDFSFNFAALWRSPGADKMRAKITRCFCAHTCNLLNAIQFDKEALLDILHL